MSVVITELIPDQLTGATFYRVSRVFPNRASAARAVIELERISPEGFESGSLDALRLERNEPVIDPLAALAAQAQHLGLYDDDMGAPGEPPRCNTGTCE